MSANKSQHHKNPEPTVQLPQLAVRPKGAAARRAMQKTRFLASPAAEEVE